MDVYKFQAENPFVNQQNEQRPNSTNSKGELSNEETIQQFNNQMESISTSLLENPNNLECFYDLITIISRLDSSLINKIDLIPKLIQSNLFPLLIDQKEIELIVLPLLFKILSCNVSETILLIQNNLCNYLLRSLFISEIELTDDIEISRYCFSCLIQIMDQSPFLYFLMYSIGIFHRFYQQLTNFEQMGAEFCILYSDQISFILTFIDEYIKRSISVNPEEMINQYDEFIQNCQNPEQFNKDLFAFAIEWTFSDEDFLIALKVISSIADNAFTYQSKGQSISTRHLNLAQFKLLFSYVSLLFDLLYQNHSLIEPVLIELQFFVKVESWISIDCHPDPRVLLKIVKIFNLCFSLSINLGDELIEQCFRQLLLIYSVDSFNDSSLQYEVISAFVNLIEFRHEYARKLFEEIDTGKFMFQIQESSFSLSKAYLYLCMSMSAYFECYSNILHDDVLMKIFNASSKREGHFVKFALNRFAVIFDRHMKAEDYDFFTFFTENDGKEYLLGLSESEDETIQSVALRVIKYFPE